MQQKTDGRVVRLSTKHLAAEDQSLEQWFLVAIADDEKAKDAVAKTAKGTDEVIESSEPSPVGHVSGPACIAHAIWFPPMEPEGPRLLPWSSTRSRKVSRQSLHVTRGREPLADMLLGDWARRPLHRVAMSSRGAAGV
jgi:hypothetical protein